MLALDQTIQAFKDRPPLKHGNWFVPVSDIAAQYYCEKKVELTYTLGKEETPVMKEGTRLHEEITKMEKASLQKLIDDIERRAFLCARFPLAAEIEGLPLVGVPDVLGFLGKGAVCFVLELKSFESSIFRLYPDRAVQAKLYGLLLEEMGFNCSEMRLYVTGVRRGISTEVSGLMLNGLLFALSLSPEIRSLSQTKYISKDMLSTLDDKRLMKLLGLEKQTVRKLEELIGAADLSIFCFPYNRDDALDVLRWAKDYWLGNRDAVPTRKMEKCKVCNYANNCKTRLTKHR